MGQKNKGKTIMNEFTPPADLVADYAANKEKRDAEYNEKNRLKEGTYEGRLLKIAEEVSRQQNPMWSVTLRCVGNEGKNIEVKSTFVKKSEYAMNEFYKIISLAGFKLKDITTEEKLGDVINKLTQDFPTVTFICKHQNDSKYNKYEITKIANIGGAAPTVAPTVAPAVAAPAALAAPATTKAAPKTASKSEPKASTEKKAPIAATEATAPEYTPEEIKTFTKEDCIGVAEELGLSLVSKSAPGMRKELIAFVGIPNEEAPAQDSTPAPAPGPGGASIFPDA